MNYDEAIKYIENTSRFGVKLGLERTERMLELLGNPHKSTKYIHIAGTNGKGSTTAMITRVLMEAGYKVGMYTSPYVEEFEERIQINNENIPKNRLSDIVEEISNIVPKIIDEGLGNPTYFEILTCMGLLYFYKENVDFAVIEVGLGGRLDSTNVITPIISIITSISFDHMHVLGNTLSDIAYEKGGIIKENIPVILYPQEYEAEKVIEDICSLRNCKLIKVNKDSVEYSYSSLRIDCKSDKNILQKFVVHTDLDKYEIELSLLGKHQLLNCATAVYAVEELINNGVTIDKEAMLNAFKNVKWPGRLEILNNNPLIVIDGAHNIDGIKKLRENVDSYFSYNNLILILGILADKQVKEMIETIVPLAKKVIAVTPHSDRAELAVDLMDEVKKINSKCEAIEDYELAFKKALDYYKSGDMILISGSLYMVGDMRKLIRHIQENDYSVKY
ncbi:folylpolyglutamate synthase [Clostridium tepidiprofundi DSM 19306]|uniref:Dihydrofolate synthase/folylpolyglutamate synthase n=1 Tax=Clostridium tepidiprofundi DSM 19306 TaxID=1121338 RepID=A0A151B6P6_9CLOT|nr:folylpolyglutamate synthase/dihydrofolate synthase family protein [Clostridium tepidiprofundi]KYH35569.1 folylpolyglutamate synthase [Clostridium tepidiprofundi DSM 19306]